MFSDVPTKFEVKATQDEPLAVEFRIGKNVLALSMMLMLLVAFKKRK
jgi:hypothetical protein